MNNTLEMDILDNPKEYNLIVDKDGRVRVRDGRSLEEYLNNKDLCKNRKKYGVKFCILVPSKKWEERYLTQSA